MELIERILCWIGFINVIIFILGMIFLAWETKHAEVVKEDFKGRSDSNDKNK